MLIILYTLIALIILFKWESILFEIKESDSVEELATVVKVYNPELRFKHRHLNSAAPFQRVEVAEMRGRYKMKFKNQELGTYTCEYGGLVASVYVGQVLEVTLKRRYRRLRLFGETFKPTTPNIEMIEPAGSFRNQKYDSLDV